jgi:5-methylcytosine-specific restriction protein B
MLDYEGFKEYLRKINHKSYSRYTNLLKNLMDILNKIDEFKDLSDIEKLKRFLKKSKEFKLQFDKYHSRNPDTYQDSISVAKKYLMYLEYKKIIEKLEEYKNNSNNEVSTQSTFFKILDDNNLYPVELIKVVEPNPGFSMREAEKYLKNVFGKNNIKFVEKNNAKQLGKVSIKNIILYGPPGVGKTYNHKKLVALIEGNDFSQQEVFDFIINNKDDEIKKGSVDKLFNKVQKENRIKFITFHQSFGYEDFIEGFRPSEEGKIELVYGVFKAIAKEAQKNLEDSKKEQSFDIEQFLNDFVTFVESKEKFEIDKDLPIEVNKNSNGEFKSFKTKGRVKNQSLTYKIIKRDFENFLNNKIKDFKDIKPSFESSNKYHGNALYYFKLYQKMKEFLKDNEANYRLNKTKLKNYYLIIDEINRANISKVFGELITLIEEDKRDSLEVTLPYSKEPFSVPSNLYIIGTLNSTDKSIALLDIALRRRFTFLKMKPNVNLVIEEFRENFEKLNEYITKTLGEDYQIGHSYFMNIEASDLDFVLEYKIKPLLEEYFYGDEEKLEQVLKIIGDI